LRRICNSCHENLDSQENPNAALRRKRPCLTHVTGSAGMSCDMECIGGLTVSLEEDVLS